MVPRSIYNTGLPICILAWGGGSAIKHDKISSSDHGAEVDEYKKVREKNNSIEERDQGLHCQIINDIPRLGTGYLIITRLISIVSKPIKIVVAS